MAPIKLAAIFLFIAFAPITAAQYGFDPLPHWFGAWCVILGYPAALVVLIGGFGGECNER